MPRIAAPAGERLQKVAGGQTGVDDIFHEQDVFILYRLVKVFGDPHQTRRTTPALENWRFPENRF